MYRIWPCLDVNELNVLKIHEVTNLLLFCTLLHAVRLAVQSFDILCKFYFKRMTVLYILKYAVSLLY